MIGGYPVLGNCNWLKEQDEIHAVCAIGCSKVRKRVIQKLNRVKFATVIDPKVEMSERIRIGEGCIICLDTILTVGCYYRVPCHNQS